MKLFEVILPVIVVVLSGCSLNSKQDTEAVAPMNAQNYKDLAYVENGHESQKLDLYLPEGEGPFPLIVWIHGGAWMSGDKENCPPYQVGFTGEGYAVASLNYRLSGDAIFPAQIEDCKTAIRWLRKHAEKYRLNPDYVGVWGASAGGHLVAMLGTTGDIRKFDVGDDLEQSSRVQAVADFFGPTDFVQMDQHAVADARLAHDDPRSPESRVIGGPIQDPKNYEKVEAANPITYVSSSDSPHLIVHGNRDPMVPYHQSVLLYHALLEKNVPAEFITVDKAGHGKGFPGKILNPIVLKFFDYFLKPSTESRTIWPETEEMMVPADFSSTQDQKKNNESTVTKGSFPSWETVLRRDDTNQDGMIAMKEFSGNPSFFKRLDANSDGFLDESEHNRFVSIMRSRQRSR